MSKNAYICKLKVCDNRLRSSGNCKQACVTLTGTIQAAEIEKHTKEKEVQYLIITLLTLFSPVKEEFGDSVTLQGIDIVASIKQDDNSKNNTRSSSRFSRTTLENRHITSLKELTSLAPNFYQPDYGSRMTSSIYVRGFGSSLSWA